MVSKVKIIILLFVISTLLGCTNEIEQQLTARSGWTIYEFEAPFDILTNGIYFDKNHTCELPLVESSDYDNKYDIGQWELISANNRNYLKIISRNPRFLNVEFEIKSIETIQDPETLGYLGKMVLESDSIKITCYRVILK